MSADLHEIRELVFGRMSFAKARNGHINCSGLDFMAGTPEDTTRLSVVNSRGDSGAAWVEIPNEDLGLVCLALWPGLAEVVDRAALAGRLGNPVYAKLAERLLKEEDDG